MYKTKKILDSYDMYLNWEKFKKQYYAAPSSSFICAHKYLDLPAHIYRTYYELTDKQLDAIFKLCVEYNFVFNGHYSKNPVEYQFELKRNDFWDPSCHVVCDKFNKIGPNFRSWGVGYSTYISLHNKQPSLFTRQNITEELKKFYTEFYKKKFKKVLMKLILTSKKTNSLMKLILMEYLT